MTMDRDLGHALDLFLADGYDELNDRVLDVVEAQISRQRQRPAWRLTWSRQMSMHAKLLGAAAAAALVIVVAAAQLLPDHGGPGASQSPTPSAAPTATPSIGSSLQPSSGAIECEAGTIGCAGQLAAGDHRSTTFQPLLTYTTTDGTWFNSLDSDNSYELAGPDGYLLIWAHPAIVERTSACEDLPASDVGAGVADWIDYITRHPGLRARNVHPVVIGGALGAGGRVGQSVDVTASIEWTPTCADDLWTANLVQFIVSRAPSPVGIYGVASNGTVRYVILQNGADSILIAFYGPNAEFEAAADRAQIVIDTMVFGCGPGIGRPCGT
jgi:hypothetical protein